jgi:uncharacterized protein YndB with AHSA1/START domain
VVPAPPSALSLEITRVIAAPRPRVFEAWTRPEIIRQWFGPGNMCVPSVETDPVAGGAYAIHMQGTLEESEVQRPSDSKNFHAKVHGAYTKVSPFDLLQFTWMAEWSPGEQSLVTVHFRDVEGGTELRLVHEQFETENSRDGHVRGWNGAFDKMAWVLTQ